MAKVAIGIDILFVPDPTKGGVIALGDVFIGNPDTDPEVEANRVDVTVVQEDGSAVLISPSAQPLGTGAGGVLLYQGSAVAVLVEGEYSLKVNDSLGAQIYYIPSQNAEATISISGGKILNGSFEATTGDQPDDWTVTTTGTGVIATDNTDQGNGLNSLKFTSVDGLGAGEALSTAFDVSSNEGVDVGFMLKSTGALNRNTVELEFLNSVGGVVSTVIVADFNAGDSPTSWTTYNVRSSNAPADAVQARARVKGMNAGGGAMVGDAWFDDIRINDNSINLGNAVTADSTVTLSNKTIHNGLYTGVQTGFIGNVEGNITGNAETVTTNANLTGDVTSVGNATTLSNNTVTDSKVVDNSLTFASKIASVNANNDHVFNGAETFLIPKGIWCFGHAVWTGNINWHIYYEVFNGHEWRIIHDEIFTLSGSADFGDANYLVATDGNNARLRNLVTGGAGALTLSMRKMM